MSTGYVLYNSMAGKKSGPEELGRIGDLMEADLVFTDVLEIKDYGEFFSGIKNEDYIIIAGGDGTLNRFINDTDGLEFQNRILYYPNGTGNDFAHELGYERECKPFEITKYLKDLPTVTVKGRTYRFLNGIGYGIDGYCCEVGDELKKIPGKKVNYTAIAIKGLLFFFKPTNAKVTVDGKSFEYKKVWIAPTMNGKFYGGGMMPTPDQERNSGSLSLMLFHGSGKLRTLMIFPKLFKGEHVKHTKNVVVMTGKDITVEFDRPVALQIDGETVLAVSSYHACVPTACAKETTSL